MAVTAICFLLIFLNPKELFSPVRNVFFKISYPFQKTFYLLSRTVSATFEFLGSISDLKNENERLVRENNFLASRAAMLEAEKKENEMLKEQLKLAPRDKFDLEASLVIGQDPQRLGSWIMINKGSDSGIKTNMPVIAYEGILIGKIGETTRDSSKVILLSDSSSAINAFDVETGAKGIVKGEYGLGIILDMVSQQENLKEGDAVLTSGLGSNMPKGLLIGKIQEIRFSGDKLFQQAVIIPRIKYLKTDAVFVIKNSL